MKFLMTWRIHDDKRMEALSAFSQMSPEDDLAEMGSNIKLIGRWHDLASFSGVAIFETEDPAAIGSWALNWASICDIEVNPVLDDAETRAIGREKMTHMTMSPN